MKQLQRHEKAFWLVLVVCILLVPDSMVVVSAESSGSGGRIVTPAEAAKARLEAEESRLRELQESMPQPVLKTAAVPVVPLRDLETLNTSLISVAQVVKLPEAFNNADSIAWSPDGKRLLFDRIRKRFYELVEVEMPETVTDGIRLRERVLRENNRDATGHQGNAIWLPGRKDDIIFVKQVPGCRDYFAAMPWYGWYCTLEAGSTQQFTSSTLVDNEYSSLKPRGVSSPCVSVDGTKLFWVSVSSKTRDKGLWGIRQLCMGNLHMTGKRPVLTGVQTVGLPTLGAFINCCGVSNDGRNFLFSANDSKNPWYATDLYLWNLSNGDMRKLTTGGWNTWGSYSPKGTKILWGSSREQSIINFGAGGTRWQKELRSDLWMMGSDGSDARRLTYFNRSDSRDSRVLGLTSYDHCYIGKVAWRPDSRQVAVVVYYGGKKTTSSVVVLLTLTDARGNG